MRSQRVSNGQSPRRFVFIIRAKLPKRQRKIRSPFFKPAPNLRIFGQNLMKTSPHTRILAHPFVHHTSSLSFFIHPRNVVPLPTVRTSSLQRNQKRAHKVVPLPAPPPLSPTLASGLRSQDALQHPRPFDDLAYPTKVGHVRDGLPCPVPSMILPTPQRSSRCPHLRISASVSQEPPALSARISSICCYSGVIAFVAPYATQTTPKRSNTYAISPKKPKAISNSSAPISKTPIPCSKLCADALGFATSPQRFNSKPKTPKKRSSTSPSKAPKTSFTPSHKPKRSNA